MSERVYDLKERTFKFAQRILDIVEQLPKKPQCEIIRTQLAKAGTSIGANVEEADGTITKYENTTKFKYYQIPILPNLVLIGSI